MGWIKCLNGWLGHGTTAAAVVPNVAQEAAAAVPAPAIVVERPWCSGWLDSSLDLRQGLAVIEHAGIDLGLALEMMLVPEGQALQ